MKNTIISVGLVIMTIITVLILYTIYGQNTRQNEIEDSLSVAVEQSLENIKFDKNYTVNNTDEFVADFMENLISSIESDSDIKVNILNADAEKGLLDVEVIETFKQPNGSTGTATCRKTIILDEYQKKEPVYYTVKFMTDKKEKNSDDYELGESTFKVYSVAEGSVIIPPKVNPQKDGYAFVGWVNEKPTDKNYSEEDCVQFNVDGKKLLANENMVFYAVYRKA